MRVSGSIWGLAETSEDIHNRYERSCTGNLADGSGFKNGLDRYVKSSSPVVENVPWSKPLDTFHCSNLRALK